MKTIFDIAWVVVSCAWTIFVSAVALSLIVRIAAKAWSVLLEWVESALNYFVSRSREVATLRSVLADFSAREKKLLNELESLRAGPPGARPTPKHGGELRKAKMAFAKLYHPDNSKADGIEKMVRAEIFKEFWGVLEDIETSTGH